MRVAWVAWVAWVAQVPQVPQVAQAETEIGRMANTPAKP
ncbi:hypothetical protein BUAM107266_31625 [Burkholderia ambifaria]